MITTLTNRLQRLSPLWTAVVVGALFTLWSIAQNPVLNDDAYQYLRAAQMVSHGDITGMYAEYGWFHYSVLIAALDKVLPGDELLAARALNLLLQALLIGVFVALAQHLHSGRRAGWLAALTLLAYPQLNELRFALIRDFGFWAFALWSLRLLLQYRDSHRFVHALGWLLTLLAATAFRLEALVLAAIAPLALLGRELRHRGLVLYALLLATALFVAAACAALHIDLLGRMQFAYRYYLPQLFALPSQLQAQAHALLQQLFTADNLPGNDNVTLGLFILLFGYGASLVSTLVPALSVPLSVFLLHALWRRWWRPLAGWRSPVGIYAIGTTASLIVFVVLMHFLTERYTMLLCLLILLQVPAILGRWIDHAKAQTSNLRYRVIAGFFVVYFFTDSLISFGPGLQHLVQARDWLRQHPDQGDGFVTTEPFLAYESKRIARYDNVRQPLPQVLAGLQSGNLFAVVVQASDSQDRALLEHDQRLVPVERFANKRGDEVRIYKVQ
ncbi:MAG TPA: hypothetical protein VMH83_13455 [Candidatus Acidoferrum sp.]|nr:hypothetical protein [Candidatus Acidoferrum sp.]